MTTLTAEQEAAIRDHLDAHPDLTAGPGGQERHCSLVAINLALSGELTDAVPPYMSLVLGKWIIAVQDRMPATMRQSAEWRTLLPLAAGTGRDHEDERRARILEWMWNALAQVEPGESWRDTWAIMLAQRTPESARAADAAAYDAYNANAAAADAADAAYDAAWTRLDPIGTLAQLVDVGAAGS